MNDSPFLERLADRLRASDYKSPRFKDNGQYMSNLICPECGDPSAWAYSNAPWSINCNRLNKCGTRTKTLDLFPELISNVEKEYTPEDENRPATIYLQRRGLNKSLKGLKYRYMANLRGLSGGVMFPVGQDEHGQPIFNGRLFDPPPKEAKGHNIGSTSGMFWKHPGITYHPEEETFVTEGIIDALSLIEIDRQAIAVLSSGQDPTKLDLGEFSKLVTAFDKDEAGKKAAQRWHKAFKGKIKTITPIKGDWNDLLTSRPKEEAKKYFEEKIEEFRVRGKLALAKTAGEYAQIFCDFYRRLLGLFPFEKQYYYSQERNGPHGPVLITNRVSNFTLDVRHFQLETVNQEEPVNRFSLEIKPRKGQSTACSVTAEEIASPHGLTTMFLQRARVLWMGGKPESLALAELIVESGAPVVRQLQATGYDSESGCYVFKTFLITPKGQMLLPNNHGFFEATRALYIRPAPHPTLSPVKGIAPKEVWWLISLAWGDKGVVAVVWVVASWFVNQIKKRIGFFPFASLHKDPQTGKTRLVRTLNAMQGLDEEGLPMVKVNTSKGEVRQLAQRSGLFKALLEGNNAEKMRFDMETILPLYNSNPLQITAKKTLDIQTRDVPFLSSLMFVQNVEQFRSRAQRERVISLKFEKKDLTVETKKALDDLLKIPLAQLSHFFVDVMAHRNQIEDEWYDEFKHCQEELYEAIPDNRLNENYALILAFHRLLCKIIEIEYDLRPYIEQLGKEKYEECNRRDETVADHFFNLLLGLDHDERDQQACYRTIAENNQLFIHIGKALKRIDDAGYRFTVQLKDLHASLKEHPSFIKSNDGRQLGGTYQKGWLFDYEKIVTDEG
ncbi:MAG: toprim domain-containing protein [Thermodesulfobacteriota bacterium]